jgi:glycosyltransferase involved in cell wall biosynthesis
MLEAMAESYCCGRLPASSAGAPLVSVIIITYQDREHVGEAIDSALAQSYPNYEIIVVDDGSTDGTGEFIVEHYGNRVRYHWKQNGGMGSARSAGLKVAAGEYVQLLDSDDILMPHKIEMQLAYLDSHPEIAFVYGRALCFYDSDLSQTWEHPANARASSGNLFDEILRNGNFVNVIQPLFRRSWLDRIGGWDPNAKASDDYDIMVRLAYAGAVGHFLDGKPVFLYRNRRQPPDPSFEEWRSQKNLTSGELYILQKLRRAMVRDSRAGIELVQRRIGELQFVLGRLRFLEGDRVGALCSISRGLWFNRERLMYKLLWLAVTSCPLGPSLLSLKHRLEGHFGKYSPGRVP